MKMKHNLMHIVTVFLLLLTFPGLLHGQNWKLIKEKDGVLLYSCQKHGKRLNLFKGVTEIKAPTEEIFAKLENVNNTDWWTKNVTQIKVLLYKKTNYLSIIWFINCRGRLKIETCV